LQQFVWHVMHGNSFVLSLGETVRFYHTGARFYSYRWHNV